MSNKRLSVAGTPTLFNYFKRSPATSAKKPKQDDVSSINLPNTDDNNPTPNRPAKRQLEKDLLGLDDSDEELIVHRTKRSRITQLKSDDENEDDPTTTCYNEVKEEVNDEDQENKKPESLIKKLEETQKKEPNKLLKKELNKLEEIPSNGTCVDEPVVWLHNKLDFLKPDKIKDKNGRRPDHPDYDPSTLYVPDSYMKDLSPGVRQWWVLKSENFDCVLFFKVGKFYELYHMDADVGVQELGFTYMRGEFAHSGFPEVSFDKMSTILIDRGYKVARVEQTETPDMMTERCKKLAKPSKFDRVVRREICQVTNRGTQVFGSQCQVTKNFQTNYMLSFAEKDEGGSSRYGVCFLDTSIGDLYIGEFQDDKNCSRFLTLLAHHPPVLVLNEKNSLSTRTQQIYRTFLSNVIKEYLPSGNQSWTAEKTLKYLGKHYFAKANETTWPTVIANMQDRSDHLGLTPDNDHKLALKALGGCIFYLKKCQLEEKVLPMVRYYSYTPPDLIEADIKAQLETAIKKPMRNNMVLDSTTLLNLRITGEEHSLYSTLDHCCTKFGKRLLYHWICSPSCNVGVIKERQNAISELLDCDEIVKEIRALLAPLPDFERHLAQIHLFGNKLVAENHPDGRAIFFEERIYNTKKIQNFVNILKGFEVLTKIPDIFQNCESALIKRLTQLEPVGSFPELKNTLNFFKNAFNHEEATKTGVIGPEKGVDPEFDCVEKKIEKINDDLKEYLVQQEKFFGCRLSYFGNDKKRFQLEVPESNAKKANNNYFLEGQKKGSKPVRRFHTNETKSFLKDMQQAEEDRNNILKDLARRMFEKFSNHYSSWQQCVNNVALLDVLCSLSEYAKNQNSICVPEFVEDVDQPFIEIDEGYHPCVAAETYIPNGVILGSDNTAPLAILTGPNMGGKSTLMRQVGLLTVMAQIGCHVPARSCRMSLVDRIFTRLGAQDDILSGHSTFLVELNETSLILKHATINSLVLLDELGRGTATYDGTAIAVSVVHFLANLKCRTLFSTHYHNLVDYFQNDKRIILGHMACMVENEDTDDPTQETVTFLYKYSAGACPKSYGFNAAKLAGMPHSVIKRAYELSKKVEAIALKKKIASKIITAADPSTIKNLIHLLKSCKVH